VPSGRGSVTSSNSVGRGTTLCPSAVAHPAPASASSSPPVLAGRSGPILAHASARPSALRCAALWRKLSRMSDVCRAFAPVVVGCGCAGRRGRSVVSVAERWTPVRELLAEILAVAPELDERTAERIETRLRERERPVSARAVAEYLGLRKTDWVYANAERLGGRRLGDGPRPRWRFSEVEERLRDFRGPRTRKPTSRPEPKPRAPRRVSASVRMGAGP
jgi:hypothetical protein